MAAVRGKDVIVAARRAAVMAGGTVVVLFAMLSLWGESLRQGIVSTTLARTPMNPATPVQLTVQLSQYVGPWLLLALVASLAIDGSGPCPQSCCSVRSSRR